MQRINSYFYPNSVTVQCSPDSTITNRWRTMYQRQVKIYRGVDNVIQFLFKNADQKPVNVTGWTITFRMFSDEEGTTVVTKDNATIGGVTVINAIAGIITASIGMYDLIDLQSPYYNYALTITDPSTGIEEVVYTDENYESRGEILLRDGPYPTVQPSIVVDLPSNNNFTITSSAIAGDSRSLQNAVHHTAQFYFLPTGFTGTLSVQGTLDPLAWTNTDSPSLTWGNVLILESGNATITTTGNVSSVLSYTNQSVTDYCNFDGVYVAVRFVVAPTNGNVNPSPVTQILYRSF